MSGASSTIEAIVRTDDCVELRRIPRPRIVDSRDVRVRVARAGLCRTDLHVAYGRMPCDPPRVLGHELSGVVEAIGPHVSRVTNGARVTIEPLLSCGECSACRSRRTCISPQMLGVDRDGGFAEEVVVPESAVHRVPDAMSFERAAYVEPVAATMAVLDAELSTDGRGVIVGRGRIAELTRRVLDAQGFPRVSMLESGDLDGWAGELDWAVDTQGTTESVASTMRALRHGGTLVLKSRPAVPVAIDVAFAVQRAIVLRAVRYAPFAAAIDLLASSAFFVEDLFDRSHPLDAFQEVFARAERNETKKIFFAPRQEPGECAA